MSSAITELPIDDSMINRRPAEEWEKPGIRRAMLARRAEAAALVSGVRPYATSPDKRDRDPDKPRPKRTRPNMVIGP
jgi:hypothetical protein